MVHQTRNRLASIFRSISPYLPLALILACASYFFFLKLGRNPFMDWDECLYSQYTREMQTASHYISNIWNDYIDMQKPPLYTWLLVALSRMFGQTEVALRSLSALASLGLITAVYLFAKRYFNVLTATLASLILLTGELPVIYSLRLSTDMVFTLFIFLAVWAWIESYKKSHWSYVAGLLFGMSTMLKGIGSVQFMGVLALTYVLRPTRETLINYVRMLAVWAVIIIPWHVLMYMHYGNDFVRVYFLENIIKRGKYPLEFHLERWWFYFVLLWKELKPWILLGALFPILWIITLFKLPKQTTLGTRMKLIWQDISKDHLTFLLILLILLPLASLTRFQTRVSWYALPLYPFIALVLARYGALFGTIGWILAGFVGFDASRLIINEVKPQLQAYSPTNREDIISASHTLPQTELFYLVSFNERQAREILPPTQQIDMTWVYGGNPCAVYYSQKKVHFIYTLKEFEEVAGVAGRLYLMRNDDADFVKIAGNKSSVKTLYSNNEYSLFTYQK